MPLDDALNLIVRHFERIVEMRAQSGSGPGDKHPEDIVTVLGFLAENRPLSVMEYDKLIKYLAQRRAQMLKMEYGENIPENLIKPPIGPPVDPEVKAKKEDLQRKIMGILDSQRDLFPSVRPAKPEPPPPINPTLQKAIDSLIMPSQPQQQHQPVPPPLPPNPVQPPLPPPPQNPMMFGAGQQPPPPPPPNPIQQQKMFAKYGGF